MSKVGVRHVTFADDVSSCCFVMLYVFYHIFFSPCREKKEKKKETHRARNKSSFFFLLLCFVLLICACGCCQCFLLSIYTLSNIYVVCTAPIHYINATLIGGESKMLILKGTLL